MCCRCHLEFSLLSSTLRFTITFRSRWPLKEKSILCLRKEFRCLHCYRNLFSCWGWYLDAERGLNKNRRSIISPICRLEYLQCNRDKKFCEKKRKSNRHKEKTNLKNIQGPMGCPGIQEKSSSVTSSASQHLKLQSSCNSPRSLDDNQDISWWK